MAAVLPSEPTTLNAPATIVTSSAAAAAAKIAVILERHERDMTMIHHPEFRGHCESCNASHDITTKNASDATFARKVSETAANSFYTSETRIVLRVIRKKFLDAVTRVEKF
ncbi:hypothetical protein HDU81_000354 [Chytriomyces hyalinus]|nr:hypothetical protein HDU81_000354 [Chytriomyces hyalinus]